MRLRSGRSTPGRDFEPCSCRRSQGDRRASALAGRFPRLSRTGGPRGDPVAPSSSIPVSLRWISVPKASASSDADHDVGRPSEPSAPSAVTAIEKARRRFGCATSTRAAARGADGSVHLGISLGIATVPADDLHRLDPMAQHDLAAACQVAIEILEEGKSRHLSTVSCLVRRTNAVESGIGGSRLMLEAADVRSSSLYRARRRPPISRRCLDPGLQVDDQIHVESEMIEIQGSPTSHAPCEARSEWRWCSGSSRARWRVVWTRTTTLSGKVSVSSTTGHSRCGGHGTQNRTWVEFTLKTR